MTVPPLEHVRQAAVDELVEPLRENVALVIHAKLVLRQVLCRLAPDLKASGLAVEAGIVAGAVQRAVLCVVVQRKAFVRADRREADDIAIGSGSAFYSRAELQQHAGSIVIGIADVE